MILSLPLLMFIKLRTEDTQRYCSLLLLIFILFLHIKIFLLNKRLASLHPKKKSFIYDKVHDLKYESYDRFVLREEYELTDAEK